MVKVWICILFYVSMGGSYSPAIAPVDNLARVEDCRRVGESWRKASHQYGSYRCVEVYKVK